MTLKAHEWELRTQSPENRAVKYYTHSHALLNSFFRTEKQIVELFTPK